MTSSRLSDRRCDSGSAVGGRACRRTASGKAAARRPQVKLSLLESTAVPFNSIAFTIAASDSGISPRWKAKPTMNRLVAMVSPISAVASAVASTNSASPGAIDSSMSRFIDPSGKARSGSLAKCAGITSAVLTSARVTPFCIFASAS